MSETLRVICGLIGVAGGLVGVYGMVVSDIAIRKVRRARELAKVRSVVCVAQCRVEGVEARVRKDDATSSKAISIMNQFPARAERAA